MRRTLPILGENGKSINFQIKGRALGNFEPGLSKV